MPRRLLVLLFILTACGSQPAISPTETPLPPTSTATPSSTLTVSPTSTRTPTLSPSPTATPTFTPTATPTPQPVPLSASNIQSAQIKRTIARDLLFGRIHHLALSPDGKWLSVSADQTTLIDLSTNLVVSELEPSLRIVFSPDGRQLAAVTSGHQIDIWDLPSFEIQESLTAHTDPIRAVAWSPNGTWIASYGLDEKLYFWDLEAGEIGQMFEIPFTDQFYEWEEVILEWSPDSSHLAIVGIDSVLRIFDGETLFTLAGYERKISHADWSPAGDFLAVSSAHDPTVTVWRVSNWNIITRMANHKFRSEAVEWSPDGTQLATVDAEQTLFIRNPLNGAILQFIPSACTVEQAFWSPDGALIACGMNIYDPISQEQMELPEGMNFSSTESHWIPGSNRLLVKNQDDRVFILDPTTGEFEWVINPEIGQVTALDYSPDGSWLAVGEAGGSVLVYDMTRGEKIDADRTHPWQISDVAWSPDGATLASSAIWQETIALWEVGAESEFTSIQLDSPSIFLDWSPVENLIISGDWDGDIYGWDPIAGKQSAYWGFQNDAVRGIKFSPDGQLAASITTTDLSLWEVESGRRIKYLSWPRETFLREIAWSPDGATLGLVSFEFGETAILYCHLIDVTEFQEILKIENCGGGAIAFSPDSQMVFLGTGTIRDAKTGEILFAIGGAGPGIWSPDGYHLITAANGLKFWGVDEAP